MSDNGATPDPLRDAARELISAARSFLDAAEQAIDDDERVAGWVDQGQEMVTAFVTGFREASGFGGAEPEPDGPDRTGVRPDDPIEPIDLD